MAEQQGAEDKDERQTNGGDEGPQAGLISQYVKDFSFENPNAPAVYQWQSQPQIDVQVNIGAQKLADGVHESALKLEVSAKVEQGVAFQLELVYAALFALRNIPEDRIQPFLLAEAPRLMFPFARRIVADAIRDGGFPPLMLEPLDFERLYQQRAQQQQVEDAGKESGDEEDAPTGSA
ncbi:MAG: protein-export chaperone SecB [Sphingomonadaceae bacterium]